VPFTEKIKSLMAAQIMLDRATVFASLSPKIQKLVSSYSSLVVYPVQWGEIDMFGHLNNVYFARYAEGARITHAHQQLSPYLGDIGYRNFVSGKGAGPILASHFIKYIYPVEFPDNMVAATRVKPGSLSADRFRLECLLISSKLERVAATTECLIVAYDHSLKTKIDVPDSWVKAIHAEPGYFE
jgi:acyl-CoA thioester hydrolase